MRIVLVDPAGNTHSLTRQLEGVSASDLRKMLRGITLERAEDVRRAITEGGQSTTDAVQPKDAQSSRKRATSRKREPEVDYWDREADTRKRDGKSSTPESSIRKRKFAPACSIAFRTRSMTGRERFTRMPNSSAIASKRR